MQADPMERLRAANPEPACPPPPIEPLWRRIDADGYPVRTTTDTAAERSRATGRSLRRVAGPIAALVAAAVVVVVMIPLLSHARHPSGGGPVGTQQLIARLAVLRRPQTAADRLPAKVHIRNPQGRIIPRLTRLVRTLPNARIYLVVTRPDGGSSPLWNPRLGDQVALVLTSGKRTVETGAVPAADLSNSNEVRMVSPTGPHPAVQTPERYYVGIVPDGVARVRWTFRSSKLKHGKFQPGAVLSPAATDNVAVARLRADTPPPVLRTAWFTADHRRLVTSDRALLTAQAAQDARLKAQAIEGLRKHPHHAARSLLDEFTVFAISSRTGVKTAAGDIVSRPRISALPLTILEAIGADDQLRLDITQVRRIVTPAGARMYVVPGAGGMCLIGGRLPSPFPDVEFSGGGGSTCAPVKSAEHGLSFGAGNFGAGVTFRIVPRSVHSITIDGSHGHQTIQVPDGVYISPLHRMGPVSSCGTPSGAGARVPFNCK